MWSGSSGTVGVNVAIESVAVKLPGTALDPLTTNDESVTDEGSIRSEKATRTVVPACTPAAPASGETSTTAGRVPSPGGTCGGGGLICDSSHETTNRQTSPTRKP